MPRAILDRDTIVAAARHVADTEGLAELTLRRVAAQLGTGPASLYRHIANRAELLALLAADLANGMPLAERTGDPFADTVRQWQQLHDYLRARPWGAQVIAGGNHAGAGHRIIKHALELLRTNGFTEADGLRTYRALWHLTLGHLVNRHPLGHVGDHPAEPPDRAEFTWAVHALLRGALAATGTSPAGPG